MECSKKMLERVMRELGVDNRRDLLARAKDAHTRDFKDRPVFVGETVYGFSGERMRVVGFDANDVVDRSAFGHEEVYVVKDGAECASTVRSDEISRNAWDVPDSWEKLEKDAGKDATDYWGCRTTDCRECPNMVDGIEPYRRYGTASCLNAKSVDIVARAKKLAGAE